MSQNWLRFSLWWKWLRLSIPEWCESNVDFGSVSHMYNIKTHDTWHCIPPFPMVNGRLQVNRLSSDKNINDKPVTLICVIFGCLQMAGYLQINHEPMLKLCQMYIYINWHSGICSEGRVLCGVKNQSTCTKILSSNDEWLDCW